MQDDGNFSARWRLVKKPLHPSTGKGLGHRPQHNRQLGEYQTGPYPQDWPASKVQGNSLIDLYKGAKMKPNDFLSLKDYFNYYISGLVWCIVFFEVGLLITGNQLIGVLNILLALDAKVGSLIPISALVIFIPYVIGFSLFPFNTLMRSAWEGEDRKCFPDPKLYVLKKGGVEFLRGRRISAKEAEQIVNQAKIIFSIHYEKDIHLYFYPIRAYVLEHGGAGAKLAERAQSLANLTESLLLPVPLVILLALVLLSATMWYGVLIGVVVAIMT